jgi:hypothetical protein
MKCRLDEFTVWSRVLVRRLFATIHSRGIPSESKCVNKVAAMIKQIVGFSPIDPE